MYQNNFIPVDNVLVRPEIMETNFSCDLEKCKGACCTIESDFGAPLLEEEIPVIAEILENIFPYLPEKHIAAIKKDGFYNRKDGEAMTMSINKKECVFVYFEKGIAKCAIEKAFLNDEISFRKPVSCHLFPIRITRFGGDVLRYEKFKECTPALEKGTKENIKIVEFCQESLKRNYGNKWYTSLMESKGK